MLLIVFVTDSPINNLHLSLYPFRGLKFAYHFDMLGCANFTANHQGNAEKLPTAVDTPFNVSGKQANERKIERAEVFI